MLVLACVLLIASSAQSHFDEASLDAQWEEWKSTHRREYNGLVSLCCIIVDAVLSYWCFKINVHFSMTERGGDLCTLTRSLRLENQCDYIKIHIHLLKLNTFAIWCSFADFF